MATAAATASSDRESEEEGTTTTWPISLPTDALVEILLRLPPSSRRWYRLVCRDWRVAIDERTPLPSNPALLAFFTDGGKSATAYAIDDIEMGRCRQLWGFRAAADPNATNRDRRHKDIDVDMVGTCNGLLCLCENTKPGGAIALLNPATGETLRLPPLPVCHRGGRRRGSWKAYSFGFHPMTGRYTVLHLPCRADVAGGVTSLQVFTLGDPSGAWRDVPVAFPGGATATTCDDDAGLVTVDGATYWVTKDGGRVASFDHEAERVALAAPLPVAGGPGSGHVLRLAEVHGSLGLAVSADRRWGPVKTEVWVLGRRRRQGWSRQYNVQVQEAVWQRLAGPHFAHGGHVLTASAHGCSNKHVFAHSVRGADAAGRLQSGGEVRSLRIKEQGTVAAYCKDGYNLRTFAYVETTERLLSDFKRRQQVHTTNLSS